MTTLIDSTEYVRQAPVGDEVLFESADTVVTSGSFSNANSKSVRVYVRYESFSPDGDAAHVHGVRAVLEEEVAPGDWEPIATQDQESFAQLSRGKHYLSYGPAPVDAGQNIVVLDSPGGQVFNSRYQGELAAGSDFRVRIARTENPATGASDLDRVCITIAYQLF